MFRTTFLARALLRGLPCAHVVAVTYHSILLRSDGTAMACGCAYDGQCCFPRAIEDLTYTQVAAVTHHTVLLRSVGTAMACGCGYDGQCYFPQVIEDLTYTQVAAVTHHTVLLRSAGTAMACGCGYDRQCCFAQVIEDLTYTQVAAVTNHTVQLRSDDTAMACGCGYDDQCCFPQAIEDLTYTQVASVAHHTVLLRSAGTAMAWGCGYDGQCYFPQATALVFTFLTAIFIMVAAFMSQRSPHSPCVPNSTANSASVERRTMQMFVKPLAGHTLAMNALVTDTIYSIKLIILSRAGIPLDHQRLLFDGRPTENGKRLSSYDIGNGDTLRLTARLRGGGRKIRHTDPPPCRRADWCGSLTTQCAGGCCGPTERNPLGSHRVHSSFLHTSIPLPPYLLRASNLHNLTGWHAFGLSPVGLQ
ncbi:unnamed protein product [Prorocentrum cordatum]|uniref:Ubiquitin-like domain-containing protein n=1 Tax=Prorocentrum cordatum TaxID=2364126 RepID=A0ABN9Y099_9DINO|nr:unnamed protein product [Polarella glacialis]